MKLTIVGSSPAYSLRPGHASSCYLVELDGTAICLDLGQGAFAALAAYRAPASLDAVFISHLHPDHHIDLVPLRHHLRFANDGSAVVCLRPPAELRTRIDALTGEDGFLSSLPGDDLVPGMHRVGSLAIEARPVTHGVNSFAFRVTPVGITAPGLVYSGDCGAADDLLPLIRPTDTVLCEASWGAAVQVPVGGLHLTASDAARVARAGGASSLLLTHVLDDYEPERALEVARTAFGGAVRLAEPGMTIHIG